MKGFLFTLVSMALSINSLILIFVFEMLSFIFGMKIVCISSAKGSEDGYGYTFVICLHWLDL